jgi:hypothetical protein
MNYEEQGTEVNRCQKVDPHQKRDNERYIPPVMKEQDAPPFYELAGLSGRALNRRYVQEFITYWNMEKIKTITNYYNYNYPGFFPGKPKIRTFTETTYQKKMKTGCSWSLIAMAEDDFPARITFIDVYFGIGNSPAILAFKARMLPKGLTITDTPEIVTKKYGRADNGLIENGNGYLDYIASPDIDRDTTFTLTFDHGQIIGCKF